MTCNYKHLLQSTLGRQVCKCLLDSIFSSLVLKRPDPPTPPPCPMSRVECFFLEQEGWFCDLAPLRDKTIVCTCALMLVIGLTPEDRSQVDSCISRFIRQTLSWYRSVTLYSLHVSPCGMRRAALTSWLASSYSFVNLSCYQGIIYRTTGDCSLISQTLMKQKKKGRKQNFNCPAQSEQKQSSPSLQHLEEVITTVDPNYSDNNTTTWRVL